MILPKTQPDFSQGGKIRPTPSETVGLEYTDKNYGVCKGVVVNGNPSSTATAQGRFVRRGSRPFRAPRLWLCWRNQFPQPPVFHSSPLLSHPTTDNEATPTTTNLHIRFFIKNSVPRDHANQTANRKPGFPTNRLPCSGVSMRVDPVAAVCDCRN